MTLSLEAITRITRDVVRRHGPGLKILGVTSTEGSSERVELLLGITGCRSGPCRIALNTNRADGDEFAHDLRSKLDTAIREHLQQDRPE